MPWLTFIGSNYPWLEQFSMVPKVFKPLKFDCNDIFKPAYDKTYNEICVTSKDSDQPVHPPSMARVLVHPSMDSPEAVEGTCDQWRLWSDCVDAQADLSLRWPYKSYCRFCHALAHLSKRPSFTSCYIGLRDKIILPGTISWICKLYQILPV